MADNGETVDNILFKPANPKTGDLITQSPIRDARDAATNIGELSYKLQQRNIEDNAAAISLVLGGGIYGL